MGLYTSRRASAAEQSLTASSKRPSTTSAAALQRERERERERAAEERGATKRERGREKYKRDEKKPVGNGGDEAGVERQRLRVARNGSLGRLPRQLAVPALLQVLTP